MPDNDDWYTGLISEQETSPLKPKERQEVRAGLVLARVARARRKRWHYWARSITVMVGAGAALAQIPFMEGIRILGRVFFRGGN